MNKKWMIFLAIVTLTLLPALAQDSTGYTNGHGNGGYGNGDCGSGGNGGNGNGNGNGGGNGNGDHNGNGPIHNILDGTPFTFSGTVINCGVSGSGLVVATSEGELTVIGLGPIHYWDSLGVPRPVVGDSVSGNGYTVDYDGVLQNVLTDITVNGITVQLRDAEGLPLWQHMGHGWYWGGPGNGGCEDCYMQILAGAPFTYSGEVLDDCAGSTGFRGDGLVISTTDGNIEVRGLGPLYYWQSLDVSRPVVGDVVTVTGYTVDYSGIPVNVLMSITLSDGTTIQLRDPETGAPLWRGGSSN
jgi:hypothetical protein